MITFFVCLILLIVAYFTYGKYMERVFRVDNTRETPSKTCYDGVDYVPLPLWKTFFIQLLNIAGLGPIFGAILGAMYGPVAFLWITLGGIFMGAVQDYGAGMISAYHKGMSYPEIVGKYLGRGVMHFMRFFTIFFMIVVGTVFLTGPAGILQEQTAIAGSVWVWVIIAYYLLAAILPIDKLIGRIYPLFSVILLFMAISMLVVVVFGDFQMVELSGDTFRNLHRNAQAFPIFPTLFITIACGAISGFHATQSPLMSRCMNSEKEGRVIFFGAMISESIIALIWAAIAMCFYGGVGQLNEMVAQANGNAGVIVTRITQTTLGDIGSKLAILGVVIASITSGDSSFRAARLMVGDMIGIPSASVKKRILICIPIFALAVLLASVKFDIIWRYFAWGNQTLAVAALWSITLFLARSRSNYFISLIPALLISFIVLQYILCDFGVGLSLPAASFCAAGVVILMLIAFIRYIRSIGRQRTS